MSYRTALAHVLTGAVALGGEPARMQGKFPRSGVTALGRAGLLGLTVAPELGGGGRGLSEAADVVGCVARVCPAAAAVLRSHYAAVAVLEVCGDTWVRAEIAAGRHLCSLALDEDGPESVARRAGEVVTLRGRKRHVVAAGEADSYLWSSRAPGAARTGRACGWSPRTLPICTCRPGWQAPDRAAVRPRRSAPTRCAYPPRPCSGRTGRVTGWCAMSCCRG